MASWKEIERLRKQPKEFVALAKSLAGQSDLTEWESLFLESIDLKNQAEGFSLRQSEKLLEIRDNNQEIERFDGFKIETLVAAAFHGRLDLNEDDEDWIVALRGKRTNSVKRREIGRLMRLVRELGIIEQEVA